MRSVNGNWSSIEKYGVLSGTLWEVMTEPNGGFWLGSSEGLAHYAPPVWTTADLVQYAIRNGLISV